MKRVRLLKDGASLLASRPEEQLKHLEDIGACETLDELALEYSDAASAAEDMVRRGELTIPQYKAAKALDEYLLTMSGRNNQTLWEIRSLFAAPEWQEVRRLAVRLIEALSTSLI